MVPYNQKKIVLAEIEEMEKNLKERQALEVIELDSLVSVVLPDLIEVVALQQVQHISKGKRNKNKKQIELEASRAEAALEAQLMPNLREQESDAIELIALSMGRSIYQISADGHCLYNAISRQLTVTSSPVQYGFKELRGLAAGHMRNNPDEFLPFLVNKNGDSMTEAEFSEHCESCQNGAVWGGQMEVIDGFSLFQILALACILKRQIHVVQVSSPVIILGEQFLPLNPIAVTYHRHAYTLGEHYNSLEITTKDLPIV